MNKRLLAVIAHPDDEAYSCAGSLARATAKGCRVKVVSATRGEAGLDLHTGLGPGRALADKRSAELASACAALGAEPPAFLDLPDGGLEGIARERATQRLAGLLQRERPALVIGLGPDGAYAHRDHLALQRWLRAAVSALPARVRPRLLEVVFPEDLFAPVHRHMRKAHTHELVADPPAGGFGVRRAAVDLVVDIRPQADAKRAALAAHRSQTRADGSFILPRVIEALMDEEWFCLVTGPCLPAGATDLLAGL